ncbi:MAG: hypothetical protein JO235_06990 [Chroococcidiopsidaceae cyanobacterium CP_BM_RX_35]|nr:hypothetical protein [Chroococcidiopsidaceae cyanobacterium CP_BM_RX_35]
MLSQFKSRYPSGSLISELLQIYQGQFVVRAEVQVDGAIRATGLAAAESLELAEDRARGRALMVLGIEPNSSARLETKPSSSFLTPTVPVELEGKSDRLPSTAGLSAQEIEASGKNVGTTNDFLEEHSQKQMTFFGNDEMQAPHDYGYQESSFEPEPIEPEIGTEVREPVDMTTVVARTSAEIKRLGWSNQQGRDYLKKTYGKRSRHELTDKELLEFLQYLELQPTPSLLPVT